jgi:guanine deaminase
MSGPPPPPRRRRALRGRIVHFVDDPATAGAAAVRDHRDGLLLIEDGRIIAVGDARDMVGQVRHGTLVDHFPDCLILPGLIDAHIHYPQSQVIASYGAQLLEWLNNYTFPAEQAFGSPAHCRAIAVHFCDVLLQHGTTTAAVYCTTHPSSVEALFAEAERRSLRMIAGKVLMDRGAPKGLLDTATRAYDESKALIGTWHGRERLLYAITPRFAVTSSEAQLEAAGRLACEHPDVYVQTHLAENPDEIATVARLFPKARHYTDVYDRVGLLGPRTVLGHCLHLQDDEFQRLHATRSVAAFCPSSNLFIGSGLFDLARMRDPGRPVRVALATDVGGGTSYSMLQTAAAAYKVLQLRGQNLPAVEAFYLMTLGNARALGLEGRIGSFAPGSEADVVVLDPRATPVKRHRMEAIRDGDIAEILFVLMMLGDDRAVRATYVLGEPAFVR